MPSFRAAVTALSVALLALACGLWLGGHPEALPGPVRDAFVDEDQAVRAELLDAIEDNYIREIDTEKLDQQSLKAIVGALEDRFSSYLTPEEARQFEERLAGRFEGVGMNVEEDPRGLKVLKVFDGAPAKRAGIKPGDVVTAVNGRSIAGVDSSVSTSRIQGPRGTKVTLEVLSGGEKRELTVERASIDVPVAESRLVERDGEKLGVVTLYSFGRNGTHGELRKQIERMLGRGARGILLDLRGNGGGLLQEAVLVASIFIEDGEIVSTKGRNKPEHRFEAEGDAIADDVELAVLVDRGSASASEIVTGALRDRHRAVVVGTRTFGKGVFQEVDELSNDGVLELVVGSYYLPGGENISDKGIEPDVKARDKPRTKRDEALPVALDVLARATQ